MDSPLKAILLRYSKSDFKIATGQILNSVGPFLLIWALCVFVFASSPTAVVALSFINGFFLTRIFVLQHDCGHFSLFPTRLQNNIAGNLISSITFTPLLNWRREHNLHHAHIGNLDKIEHGDFWILTQEQYVAAPARTRLLYRIYRFPLFLFVIGPLFYLVIRRRFPVNLPTHLKTERRNVQWTNLGLLLLYGPLCAFFGWKLLLLMVIPALATGASICIWGFFVQHTYAEGYWEREAHWNYYEAAFRGSSYYDLPRWVLWFSADISVHHIHHLDAKIPNYLLQKCLRENPELKPKKSMTFLESLKCASLKLWDEENKRYIGYPT